MHVLTKLDSRTLLACDFLLMTAFSVVLFAMKRCYPVLHGVNTVAISFLLGIPGAFLLASWGWMPHGLTITAAYLFILASFLFLYRGILRFIGSRRTILLPVVLSCLALVALFYFSQIERSAGGRVITIALAIAGVRGLIALELLRKSPSFANPLSMRLFAAFMAFIAASTVECGLATVFSGSHFGVVDSGLFTTRLLFLGVVSVCVTGIFILWLSSGELIARSRDESLKDSLSGAFNRRGIEAKLETELKQLAGSKTRLSIALIDVDYFKAINDVQGHAAGDAALRDVAEAISSHLRGRDYLGRYGGDEFLLILPNTVSAIALTVTERLSKAVTALHLSTGLLPLTLSIGITEAVPHDDLASVLARADKALYQAKSDGRNCRRIYVDADEKLERQTDLRSPVLMGAANSNLLPQ